MEEKIVYFEEPGRDNTDTTLKLAEERAKARGIKTIVIASTRGDTAKQAAQMYAGKGIRLVVVPHQYGFGEAQRFSPELVKELESRGQVYFGTMLFHTDSLYGAHEGSLIATILRMFCQGMKVAVEIVMMAADGGCVAKGEKVVCITGTGRGADTAVVMTAAPSTMMHEMHVSEIICKPLESKSMPIGARPAPAPPRQEPEAHG